ncbi:tRNA lysidine(34) synthetase TilS [candidate division WOR-1 bacterium RIFOXYB2_FULL_42_35]|uniref:tRNA(Ile)-lysidine synthase n=1 Tax=candidate division WOR-1 bacterium RIFOXYC2_FULL_41_25 TaxID=1802586 RepID=A0A1F4TPL4_UNCSA|nr:MAG: tRNA lysidine(34) synthetase TilS [candidate division WOR-1 bacterium RIFOXYB2_FULL_42_35]OGC24582.1 MAG: tRNA lysidine(34) synthetase TilS [candidate division WOR-1 bacterium RIFOXYA2_FULL_41_14]OGC34628.1 MAG: tRNA lysidine(34) synthetase TilS [candidate division WOR-1 bacterium RIFOXYC2_FULL_41_25]
MIKEKFIETVNEFKMFKKGDTVLAAVSGGADSVALLNLLASCQEQFKLKLHVAHLNHLLRKNDAELDVRYVQNISQSLGIPAIVEAIDVAEFAKTHKLGIEAAARKVRYGFLERVAERIGANKIAVGHTADDNVETFLMRLLRGSGIKGLCGIPAKRGMIIRPMIRLWRRQIEDYVGSLKLVPRRDYTNYESKYMRSRVRMKLIPQLKLYNLNIKEIILQTILLLTEDKAYLEAKAEKVLNEVILSRGQDELQLKIARLKEAELPIQGHVLRRAIYELKGDLLDFSYSHIQDILAKLDAEEKWELHLPGGAFVLGNRGILTLSRNKPNKIEPVTFCYTLTVPGEIEIKEIGKRLVAEVIGRKELGEDPEIAFLDHDFLAKKLIVRSRSEGDSFSPLGMRGSKKIQDFLIDEKVPEEVRDTIPIVTSGKDIVWVGGMRIDERVKVKKNSRKVVRLTLQ